jgi:hypothetical protein
MLGETPAPPGDLYADAARIAAQLIEEKAHSLDTALANLSLDDDPAPAETVAQLLGASFEPLLHAEAIAQHCGAAWNPDDRALLRATMSEFGDGELDADDLRRAVNVLMRMPDPND